ncbi:hypothetical protein [Lacrimispora sp.]|uniref:hypothetical protein n=1 Tax=Lacrimispora sp. TaxID=2719234 RepID=UPI002FDB87B5
MKKFIKRIVSFLLSIAMLLSSATYVFAQEQVYDGKKSNIHYEKGSIEALLDSTSSRSSFKELIYTYDQNGESYRVYDQVNSDLTYTHSSIFKIEKNQKETLVRREIVNVANNMVTTTIIENGKETTHVLDLNSSNKSEFANAPTPMGTWDGWPVSNTFEHYGTFKYSYSITGTTTAAVTVTINAIVKFANINPYAKVAVTIISGIVNYIVKENVKRTYVIEDVSFRWTQIPNIPVQQRAVERTIRKFHADSNYATVIDSATTTVYAKDYKD